MCVRRQLIWRRPELETQACRSLPLQKRDSVESSVRWAENFGAQKMPMRREGIVAVHCRQTQDRLRLDSKLLLTCPACLLGPPASPVPEDKLKLVQSRTLLAAFSRARQNF